MAKYALLYNLDRCIGCRTCMVICRQEGNELIKSPIHTVAHTNPGFSEGVMWHFPVPMAEHRTSK
jgi:Fe-S-cluster-containing dehydrogenase component